MQYRDIFNSVYRPAPLASESEIRFWQLRNLSSQARLDDIKIAEIERQMRERQDVNAAANAAWQGPQSATANTGGMILGGTPPASQGEFDPHTFSPGAPTPAMQIPGRDVGVSNPGGMDRLKFLMGLGQRGHAQLADEQGHQFRMRDIGENKASAALDEQIARAGDAQLERTHKALDAVYRRFTPIKDAPDYMKESIYASTVNDGIQNGWLKRGQVPDRYPGDAQLQVWEDQTLTSIQRVQAEIARRRLGSKTAKIGDGVFQYDYDSAGYDTRLGGLPDTSETPFESYLDAHGGNDQAALDAYNADKMKLKMAGSRGRGGRGGGPKEATPGNYQSAVVRKDKALRELENRFTRTPDGNYMDKNYNVIPADAYQGWLKKQKAQIQQAFENEWGTLESRSRPGTSTADLNRPMWRVPTVKGARLSRQTARKYLQEADGDQELAEQMAQEDGWTF